MENRFLQPAAQRASAHWTPVQAREPFVPWLACAVVWIVLNFMFIACIDERTDWSHRFSVNAHTLSVYQQVSSGTDLQSGILARFWAPSPFQKPVPLVVFLHGAGQRGYDNIQQLQTLPQQLLLSREFPCAVLAPQCPPGTSWGNWSEELEDLIEQTIQKNRIDPNRVYLTGLSMGGFGTWELAAHRPDLFAAVVPVCGGGNTQRAEQFKSLPLWAVHGSNDTVVLPERSREMITAIQAIGGTPRYSELAGVGHDSWKQAYDPESGILNWMFQQRRQTPSKIHK